MSAEIDRPKAAGNRPLIRLENIERTYPTGVAALRGVSIDAYESEVVCIVGPSGSGKSTLLRCVNALEPVDGGRVLFGGQDTPRKGKPLRELRRQIGMVFQNFELTAFGGTAAARRDRQGAGDEPPRHAL